MEHDRIYSKEKRKKIDRCNICGKIEELTWDHVPPKFCFNNQLAVYNSVFDLSKGEKFKQISQNGIKYRSICSNCNNSIMGRNYDIEYKKIVDIFIIYILILEK